MNNLRLFLFSLTLTLKRNKSLTYGYKEGENVMEDNKDTKVEEVEKENTEKTYTQQDIDNSFNAGVKKAKTEWQKDEKYKEFLEWKKQSQTENDKINELTQSNTDLTNQNTNLSKQIALLQAQIQVNNSDVKKEFAKFVTSEVFEMVNDTTDFETALKKYKKDNPQYFGEMQIKKVQTAPNLNGGVTQQSTTNSIMNSLIRGARE